MSESPPSSTWLAVQSAEAQAGEIRVQLLRLLGVIGFYGNHLVQSFVFQTTGALSADYQAQVMALVGLWVVSILAVVGAVHLRRWRGWIPYATTIYDGVLISLLLMVGAGPNSWLVLLFFVNVAASPLRLQLPLVSVSVVVGWVGYLAVLGEYVLHDVGWEAYYAAESTARVDYAQQVIVLLGLLMCGLFAGQSLRQTRRVVCGLVGTTLVDRSNDSPS